jgi:hypothetical protein
LKSSCCGCPPDCDCRTRLIILNNGGYGLPDDVVPARALILLCLIEGLKLRGARGPEPDRIVLRSTLAQLLESLVSPPG